jgi:hypothetical protein
MARAIGWAAAVWLAAAGSAAAGEAGDLARAHLYAGTIAEGAAALEAMTVAAPDDAEAWYGLGMLRFAGAVEGLGQALHRHGLVQGGGMELALLRLPVPPNDAPETLTPEAFRTVLSDFETRLAAAEAALSKVGDATVKLPLDLTRVRMRFDPAGAAPDRSLWAVFAEMNGADAGQASASTLEVGFDAADAAWLSGYSHLLMAFTGFVLAYDTSETVTTGIAYWFPRSSEAYRALDDATLPSLNSWERPIAEAISFFHGIHWPLKEPQRMPAVRAHLKAVTATSRESWRLILAETDNDREWVPSPTQAGVIPGLTVDQAQVEAWHGVLDLLDGVLDGTVLLPHWRLTGGFDLKAFFEEPPAVFDLVMTITGPSALPYLRTGGQTVSQDDFWQLQGAFQGQFMTYAVWFN